ncbi:MAG: AraC family transcriptional regulator [Ruminococcus sp.]|nr:AraC family transcriptional regulator [Ruminococcus sp.]
MNKELHHIETMLQSVPNSTINHISLYHGIDLYFYTVNTDNFSVHHQKISHIMKINYCRKGRLICDMNNDNKIYLGSGDFSLHTLDVYCDSTLYFPTGNYEGLSLYIDFKKLLINPPELLEETGICHELFSNKFWHKGSFASFSGSTQTDAIFSAFYDCPEHLKLAYYKIKSIELLLYLSTIQTSNDCYLTEYRSEQIEIIRQVHDYLTDNIGKHITIEELSRQYLINPTTLKSVFKSVYGNSLASHIKEHRMELASKFLRETDLSIAQISKKVGYESQSKFTSVFKAYYKILPKEYRKNFIK